MEALMTLDEVATSLRCCHSTVRRLVADGRLPVVRFRVGRGSRLLFRSSALAEVIQKLETP